MLGVQSVILATIGTAGPEISRTREETRQIQVDNEVLKAKIRELQTSAQVASTIENELGMKQTDLIRLESPIDSTNAVALVD
jgi:post-segregation antitoxin (ccd killing protein)